ncbi:MAG: outer membrane beta-barrel protein [Gammaproteobacteria bacterium]|jgi:opacity protein-like surface antigen
MKKLALLLFVSVFPLSGAQAQNVFSLGVAVGSADQEYSNLFTEVSGSDTSIGIRLGAPVGEFMVIEGALYNFGEANDNYFDEFGDFITTKSSTTSINGGFAGVIPLSYAADLVGRIGLTLWDSEIEITDSAFPGEVSVDDDNGVGIYFGFGARAKVAYNIKVGFEYMFFDFEPSYFGVTGDQSIDNFALTLDVGF